MLEAFINPTSQLLLLISTSIQAKDMIVHDLLNASKIVKDQMKKFIDEHIGANSTMSFFDPEKNNKLNTLKNISKITTCNHYTHYFS